MPFLCARRDALPDTTLAAMVRREKGRRSISPAPRRGEIRRRASRSSSESRCLLTIQDPLWRMTPAKLPPICSANSIRPSAIPPYSPAGRSAPHGSSAPECDRRSGLFPAPVPAADERGRPGRTCHNRSERRRQADLQPQIRRFRSTSDNPAPIPTRSTPSSSPFPGKGRSTPRGPASTNSSFAAKNAFRLYINDLKAALVDGWIKSGNQIEYRETLQPLGGRSYPLRLHFTKSTGSSRRSIEGKGRTGVDAALGDRRTRTPRSSPAKCSSPQSEFDAVLASPSSRRSQHRIRTGNFHQCRRGAGDHYAAIETAEFIRERLPDFLSRQEPQPGNVAGLRRFCRAFSCRTGLPSAARTRRIAGCSIDRRPFERAPDPESAVERVVLMVLKSPRFLYPGPTVSQPMGSPSPPGWH